MSQFSHGVVVRWGKGLDTVKTWDRLIEWTVNTFGMPGPNWQAETNIADMIFWFAQPHDRTLFVMKWGSDHCKVLS